MCLLSKNTSVFSNRAIATNVSPAQRLGVEHGVHYFVNVTSVSMTDDRDLNDCMATSGLDDCRWVLLRECWTAGSEG